MRISVNAGELANALALAASLSSDRAHRLLDVVRLSATGDTLTVTTNVRDFMLTLTVPAEIAAAGEVAVPASRLAALAAGFTGEAVIEISGGETAARVNCGRSHFRLPIILPQGLPAPLALVEETGRAELEREEASSLLVRPAFAASTEQTRVYLNGILLRDDEGALAAVATDGHRLARSRVPGAAGLSPDFTLIVPNAALKIISKLLADKSVERVMLRRSETLISIEAAGFNFISKLIDNAFPDYKRVIPKPSGNRVTVDRVELLQALARVGAVAEEGRGRIAGLRWTAVEPVLRLCLADGGDVADDAVEAEVCGVGAVALSISYLVEMLEATNGERVQLDSRSAGDAVLITSLDDDAFIGITMPHRWAALTQAA